VQEISIVKMRAIEKSELPGEGGGEGWTPVETGGDNHRKIKITELYKGKRIFTILASLNIPEP